MKKKLPDPDSSIGWLFKLPYDALKWELIKTATELKIFDANSQNRQALKKSAQELSLHPSKHGIFPECPCRSRNLLVKERRKIWEFACSPESFLEERKTTRQ